MSFSGFFGLGLIHEVAVTYLPQVETWQSSKHSC